MPLLSLYEIRAIAAEIFADPADRGVKRLAGQILAECKGEPQLDAFRDLAEAIRAATDAGERARLSQEIAARATALIDPVVEGLESGQLLPAPARSYLVLDVETLRPVRPADTMIVPGIEYAASFQDWAGLGISVVGAGNEHGADAAFTADILASLELLIANSDSWIVTFNGVKFDVPLLAAHGVNVPAARHFDILRAAWIAAGLDPDRYAKETHSGYSLDDFARVNLDARKTGDGHNAAVLWQQGRRQEVIEYCLHDVRLERALFELILKNGGLVSPKTGEFLAIQVKGRE